jgi:putative alpha-1,2-mannosidase
LRKHWNIKNTGRKILLLTKDDIDKMPARGMYQGTVWQYRWFVPFDIKGLKDVMGGEKNYISQLDQFLLRIITIMLTTILQVPGMYNASTQPWKSQNCINLY